LIRFGGDEQPQHYDRRVIERRGDADQVLEEAPSKAVSGTQYCFYVILRKTARKNVRPENHPPSLSRLRVVLVVAAKKETNTMYV